MSNIYEYIKMAIHNIMANKGRSFLTMLGIIIGIASVIAIVSIGEGTKNQMNSEINDIGGGQIAVYCSDDAIADQVWLVINPISTIRLRKPPCPSTFTITPFSPVFNSDKRIVFLPFFSILGAKIILMSARHK